MASVTKQGILQVLILARNITLVFLILSWRREWSSMATRVAKILTYRSNQDLIVTLRIRHAMDRKGKKEKRKEKKRKNI